MKKTLNILKKMKVSTSVPRVIAEIGCNHMGDFDLAKKMINLSGFELKDENNKNGEIEIKFLGLREGEKMNEEFDGDWDPDTMTSPKKLQKVIIKGGYHFMGDHIMMS